MIKVTEVVREVLFGSEIALSAMANGYLNLSSYAASIQPEVERHCRKPVRVGTVVVALSRLAKTLDASKDLVPEVEIRHIAAKTGLVELTFDKTRVNREKLQRLYQDNDFLSADFFTVTYGIGELSIVVPSNLKQAVLKLYAKQKPILLLEDLAALTVRFDETYIHIPNITFALLRPLAMRRINIVEIVSTYTELTFILHQSELKEAFVILSSIWQAAGQKLRSDKSY